MKTLAAGFGLFLALSSVSIGTSNLRAAPLPQAPSFSNTPLEVPSLGLKDQPANPFPPFFAPLPLRDFSKGKESSSRSPVDHMPIALPKTDVDYKLIVKTPDPAVDYKMVIRDVPAPVDVK